MELGSNFASRLEPFLLMGKSMKGAAAAKLIQDATSASSVFVFSELLELPNIQDLAKNEQHQKSYALLQLFSYKTYQDYLQNQAQLPSLNAAQTTKLKHLSIVSLASQKRILPYSELMEALQMPTIRELEDLIIDAIYLDLLRGKLDQKEGQLEVEYTMGRDLEPGKLETLLQALKDWASTTSSVLSTLDEQISNISTQAAVAKATQEEHDKEVQALMKEVSEKSKDKNNSGGGGNFNQMLSSTRRAFTGQGQNQNVNVGDRDRDMRMDVDEPMDGGSGSKGKNRKAPQPEATKPLRKRNRF